MTATRRNVTPLVMDEPAPSPDRVALLRQAELLRRLSTTVLDKRVARRIHFLSTRLATIAAAEDEDLGIIRGSGPRRGARAQGVL